MRDWSENERRQGRRIVFVPTMGFLHEGHLCLVRDARKRGHRVVVSIFVNPTQFSPSEDFAGYPRDFERDRGLLEKEQIDVLFHPPVAEMYPAGVETHVEVERLSLPLCGAARSGHFRGVATIVTKLFNIVRPHAAIFGEKDYQQLQVIRQLVRDLSMNVEIVGHPIVRESDGVAMSSRNSYLTPDERRAAVCLSQSLCKAERLFRRGEKSARAIIDRVASVLAEQPLAQVEYVKLCDAETLTDIDQIRGTALLALAVRIGRARLIDNRLLKSPGA
ncbi:MAG TPA: pantoate--beta-alanine ligase [Burkholderiales bacterium]|nr:pantoate--beta-alanine ligase [Burkholderiales bacterium]